MKWRSLLHIVLLLLLLSAPCAAAEEDPPSPQAPLSPGSDALASEGAPPASPPGWQWRKTTPWEYAVVGGAAAASLYLEYGAEPESPKWSARNGFDESVRDALRVSSESTRRGLNHAADALMGFMIAAPAVDSIVVHGYRDRDWDALLHTTVVNIESFTFTSFVSVLLQTQLARERPFVRNCVNGRCESDQIYRSMPSGHAAYSFTGAGLLCTHHEFQPQMYGNRTADHAVCATALGLASVDSVMRIMSDGHYMSDVLAGTAIGLFSGFLLPRLLHYWSPAPPAPPEKKTVRKPRTRLVVAPAILPGNGAGLSCRYHF